MAMYALLIARDHTSVMEIGVTITTQFEKEGGDMICKGCGKVGEYVVCSARLGKP